MLVRVAIFEPGQAGDEFDELGPFQKCVLLIALGRFLITSLLAHIKGLDHLLVIHVLKTPAYELKDLVD